MPLNWLRPRRRTKSALFRAVREASYPPPYPDGWYRVATSTDIPPGQVRQVECLGQHIALFRGEVDGRIHAVQAFCPHLGANLADGRVIGDQLRCPFHGWCVDGAGTVRQIPYSESVPTRRHPAWDVEDYYGMVLIYHSADGPRPAPYRLPAQPGIDDGRMVYRGEYFVGTPEMHVLEFLENAADDQHFPELHERLAIPWTTIGLPFVKVHHHITQDQGSGPAHAYRFQNRVVLSLFGRPMPFTKAEARLTYHGPAGLTQFDFEVSNGACATLFQTSTPIEPMKQHIQFRWYADRTMPRLLVLWLIGTYASQMKMDLAIWERKIYRRSPLLARGDGPVRELRQWYQQFYATRNCDRTRPEH